MSSSWTFITAQLLTLAVVIWLLRQIFCISCSVILRYWFLVQLQLTHVNWTYAWAKEDEMVGWHHWFNGHEFEQAPGAGDGQGSLACCSPWGHRVRHDWATELNWTKLNIHVQNPRSPFSSQRSSFIFQVYCRKNWASGPVHNCNWFLEEVECSTWESLAHHPEPWLEKCEVWWYQMSISDSMFQKILNLQIPLNPLGVQNFLTLLYSALSHLFSGRWFRDLFFKETCTLLCTTA